MKRTSNLFALGWGILALGLILYGRAEAASAETNRPVASPEASGGSVCLAPLRASADPIADSSTPEGQERGGVETGQVGGPEPTPETRAHLSPTSPEDFAPQHLSVEADKNGWIQASRDRARSLGPLARKGEHLIKIREGEKIVQAFLLDFEVSSAREYCVFYREAKRAWAMLPLTSALDWCACDHSAYVPPQVEEEEDPPGDEHGKSESR